MVCIKSSWWETRRGFLKMIAIINIGLGNVLAFVNIYRRLNIPVVIAENHEDVASATHLILPGVGAFDWAIKCLNSSGLRESIENSVLVHKKPILGVCVGMQIMAKRSAEGKLNGLGWIDANVERIPLEESPSLSLPHMGWNDVDVMQQCLLFNGLLNPRYYFLHSFYVNAKDSHVRVATAEYGKPICVAFQKENIFGTQFHPEKSHSWGVSLLKNFAET
jgi:glutamine amidotransferase